jgi:hypothetical protein
LRECGLRGGVDDQHLFNGDFIPWVNPVRIGNVCINFPNMRPKISIFQILLCDSPEGVSGFDRMDLNSFRMSFNLVGGPMSVGLLDQISRRFPLDGNLTIGLG